MDNTLSKDQVLDTLRQFDRQKESDRFDESAKISRNVASAINADTPVTILTDMRQQLSDMHKSMERLVESIDTLTDYLREAERRSTEAQDDRHREILAFIHKASQTTTTSIPTHIPAQQHRGRASIGSQDDTQVKHYYKGDELKTNQSVIACVLIQLEQMISRSLPSSTDISDTTIMGLKEWSTACTILREVSSSATPNTGALTFPKKSSDECSAAMDAVASTTQGRGVTCKEEHFVKLLNSCPAVVRCAEEVRLRAIACPGIISSLRLRNLSAISFPYITKDGSLNITNSTPRTIGSITVYDIIKKFSIKQKKRYVSLVLEDGKKPITAVNLASNEE